MSREQSIRRYRRWYRALLRLYPQAHRERFGEGMEQTFSDLLREREAEGRALLGGALSMGAETLGGIVRERGAMVIARNRSIGVIALATAAMLLVPLVAMQFTDEVMWSLADFVVAGGLLFGAGLAFELLARRAGKFEYRAAAGLALGSALFLIWANLAVGVIGSEDEAANLMYGAVLGVGVIGAVVARFQPGGMALALFMMALTQAAIAVIALLAGMHEYEGSSVAEVVSVNGLFVVLFVVSGLLFQRAAARGGG